MVKRKRPKKRGSLLKEPFVHLERDLKLESLVNKDVHKEKDMVKGVGAEVNVEVGEVNTKVDVQTNCDVDPTKGKCFLCGGLELASGRQARRLYHEQTTLFKGFLMNVQVQRKISPVVYKHFTNNVGSCAPCLGMIKEVWDLQQQLLSIRQELDDVVIKGRERLILRCDGAGGDFILPHDDLPTTKVMDRLKVTTIKSNKPSEPPNKPSEPRFDIGREDDGDGRIEMIVGYTLTETQSQPLKEDEDGEKGAESLEVQSSIISNTRQIRQSKRNASKIWKSLSPVSKSERVDAVTKVNGSTKSEDDEFSAYDQNQNPNEEDDAFDSESESELKKLKKANSNSKIIRNKKVDISGRKLECSKCGKKFQRAVHLISHEVKICKIHYDEEEIKRMNVEFYSCHLCDLKFTGRRDQERHIRTHTKEKPFGCKKCGKSYTQLSSLNLHNKTYCRAGGIDPEFRKQHMEKQRLNKSKSSLKCPKCTRKFITSDKLAAHVRTHQANPDKTGVLCELCGKCISSSYGVLQKHIRRVHSKEHSVFCSYCGKGYFANSDLLKHVRNHHEKDKNVEPLPKQKFKCDHCDKYFSKTALYHHKQRRHLGTKKVECDICHFKFYSKFDLIKHQKTHNKVTHECLKCGLRFIRFGRLERHQKTMPNCDQQKIRQYKKKKVEQLTCPHCQEVFPGRFRFKLHMKHVHPDEGNDDYKEEREGFVQEIQVIEVSTSEAVAILECEIVTDDFKLLQ